MLAGAACVALVASACAGHWERSPTPSPVRAIHAALLPTGQVLLVGGSGNDPAQFAAGTFRTAVWDPSTDTFSDVTTPWDAFCSGHAFLPDGRVLVVGGTAAYPTTNPRRDFAGSDKAYIFDPWTQTYEAVPSLASGHWYPTVVERADGTMVAVAGLDENRTLKSKYQIFDPVTGTWSAEADTSQFFPMYPALHLMADGRFFFSGVNTFGTGGQPPGIWDSTTNTFVPVAGLTDRDRRDQGASVLLPPAQDQRVMVMGGGEHNDTSVYATASTAIIDLKQPVPVFTPGPPLDAAKQYVSAVILPDRTVVQTNGTTKSWLASDRQWVYSTQLYHPDTNTWEKAPDATIGRTYHSEALLLPDGRVATFGSNSSTTGAPFEMRIEIYSPPYMDKDRPTISVAPDATTVSLGASLTVNADRPLQWLELVRPSSATHSNDPDQRLVDLPFTQDDAFVATATVPDSGAMLPPGWYMLFGVDTEGVPSVATWIHVTAPAA